MYMRDTKKESAIFLLTSLWNWLIITTVPLITLLEEMIINKSANLFRTLKVTKHHIIEHYDMVLQYLSEARTLSPREES